MSKKDFFVRFQKSSPEYVLAGVVAGICAGFLIAFLESMFLLVTVGPFWVDLSFLAKAFLIYGLSGMMGGSLCSLFFYIVFFWRRPLQKTRPWVFFLALLTGLGLVLEMLLYLMDIHTFRKLNGEWTMMAYLVFAGSLLVACLAGWMVRLLCQRLFHERIRRHWLAGSMTFILFVFLFFLSRSFFVLRDRAQYEHFSGQDAKTRVNIIILLADSMRPDHLSAYGYPLPTSPVIDRLAREGILFLNCMAASTWTVPTHTSIFTGLYPSSHGNYSMYSSLNPMVPTLSQILTSRGYRTASLFENKLLGSRHGLSRGFQTSLGVDNVDKVSLSIFRLWQRLIGNRSISGTILDAATKWIEYRSLRQQPFFLFVNFMDTHVPYRPKKPYIDDFLRSLPDRKVDPELARQFTTDGIITRKAAIDLAKRMDTADWRWLERFYDSNIRALDDHIGNFLACLQARGFLQNTLVIITSDHGEYFGEKGVGGHLNSAMHQAGLHIPLVCWLPERLVPGQVEQLVSQVDIFPTVLEMAGLGGDVPGNVHGRNLFSIQESRELLSEFWDDIRHCFSRALFSGEYKLVIAPDGKTELFNLKEDDEERIDLAQRFPDRVETLVFRLHELLESMPLRTRLEDARKKEEMKKLLQSLGYL